jgi:branched-subunit amino acid transport protein
MTWYWILLGALGCYLLKAVGLYLPPSWFASEPVRRITDALPIAVLVSLAVSGTFAAGPHLVLDHRAAGLLAAVVAVALRAPFVVVVLAAALAGAAAAGLG